MRLGIRIGQKNPRKRVQLALKHESAFSIQGPIRDFWSAERHFESAKLPSCGLWPNGFRVMIMHTLFNPFAKGCIRIQTLVVHTYFLGISDLYK